MPRFSAGAARRMCESIGTTGRPFASFASRSTLSNSCAAPSGAPLTFARPIVCSWSTSVARSQTSISMRMRRATRYVPPASHSGCASSGTQTCLASSLVVLELDVVGAVLEAHEVARRVLRAARRRRAAEAELRPAHHDAAAADAREVAHGVEGDLRVVGAGLDADVAAALRRVERVVAERRQLLQRRRALRREAVAASSNSDGPRPKVIVSRAVCSPTASPVSCGGAFGSSLIGPAGSAGGHQRRRGRPGAQQVLDVLARVGHDVEGREVQPVLRGRGDAGLARAVERDRVAGRRRVRRRRSGARRRGRRARARRRRLLRRAAACGG